MIYMHQPHQEKFSPLSMMEFMENLTRFDSSRSTFFSLWRCLKTSKYLGFGYFNITGNPPSLKYVDGVGTSEQSKARLEIYDNVFRAFTEKGLLTRHVVHAEGSPGSYIICPVYGPYHQNAIFILHAAKAQDEHDEEELRRIDMVLQSTHVVIAEYESSQREKKLSLSRREEEVLILMSDGMSNRCIADQLNISVHTINGYVRRIMLKLNTTDRISACMIALSIPKIANKARRLPSGIYQRNYPAFMTAI